MDGANALALLGLGTSATRQEVASAFRAAALRHHPDHGGSRDEFELVYAAYAVLRDRPSPKQPSPFLNFAPTPIAKFDAYDATRRPAKPRLRSFANELATAMAA